MALVGTVLSPASVGGSVSLGPRRSPAASSHGFQEPGAT